MANPQFDSKTSTLMALLLLFVSGAVVQAATIDVVVLGPDGVPVPGVAVFVEQEGGRVSNTAPATAVMDQREKRFVPHLLIVKKGSSVEFPNSDVIGHHVYSFSKPKNFVLPLYKGDPHDPVIFDHDGVITLGCNIHDSMVGYIVVVDTDVFGLTDESGHVSLGVSDSANRHVVNIWSPRIRDAEPDLSQVVGKMSATKMELTFALHKKLRAPHQEQTDAVQWSEY